MAFTHTLGRFASFGTVATIPSEVIDTFWMIIDQYLKHVVPLEEVLTFELIDREGKLSVRFYQDETESADSFEIVIDTELTFNKDWPRLFHACDDHGRETIMTPKELSI